MSMFTVTDTVENATTGEVTLLPTADFNGDGQVNGADLTTWLANFGLASGAAVSQGDGNRDGTVDGTDFLVWQRQLGSFTPVVSADAFVPEPATSMLVIIAAAGLCLRRSRAA